MEFSTLLMIFRISLILSSGVLSSRGGGSFPTLFFSLLT